MGFTRNHITRTLLVTQWCCW